MNITRYISRKLSFVTAALSVLFATGACTFHQEAATISGNETDATIGLQLVVGGIEGTSRDISQIRIIVFDSRTGNKVSNELYDVQADANSTIRITHQTTKGLRDIYIIANECAAAKQVSDTLAHTTNRSSFRSPLLSAIDWDSTSAIDTPDSYVMSTRIEGVDITGGTREDPLNINSVVNSGHSFALKRHLAALSLIVKSPDANLMTTAATQATAWIRVNSIRLVNAAGTWSILESKSAYTGARIDVDLDSSVTIDNRHGTRTKRNNNFTYSYSWDWAIHSPTLYIPEHILADATSSTYGTYLVINATPYRAASPSGWTWNRYGDYTYYGTILYANAGTSRNFYVPVKSTDTDFNIYRNTQYNIVCTFRSNWGNDYDPTLEVATEVVPWQRQDSNTEFAPAEWELAPSNEAAVTGRIVHSPEVVNTQLNRAEYRLRVTAPRNAKWNVTLTNGYDFELLTDNGAVVHGAQSSTTEYIIRIAPTRVWESGADRTTDLQLLINNRIEHTVASIRQVAP